VFCGSGTLSSSFHLFLFFFLHLDFLFAHFFLAVLMATAAGASTAASVWTHFMCPASRLWCLSHDRERKKERCHAFMRTLFGCFLCGFELKISSLLPQTNRALLCGKLERKARDSKDEEADPSRERQTGIRGLFCALVLSLSQNRVVV
jgi:hypothetical protein